MGVWVDQELGLSIRPYQDTLTAHNIENKGEAVLNLSQNPQLFLILAFKDELPQSKQVVFESAKTVQAPRIKGASGFVEVVANRKNVTELEAPFKEFVLSVQHIEVASSFPLVHSRARSAAIECVIHATKIRALYQTDPSTVKRLTHQIDELHDFVERIAPNSPSAEIIHRIESLLPKWIK